MSRFYEALEELSKQMKDFRGLNVERMSREQEENEDMGMLQIS